MTIPQSKKDKELAELIDAYGIRTKGDLRRYLKSQEPEYRLQTVMFIRTLLTDPDVRDLLSTMRTDQTSH